MRLDIAKEILYKRTKMESNHLCCKILEGISKAQNSNQVKDVLCKELKLVSSDKYDKLLSKIRKLGINPITFSTDWNLPDDIPDVLPNPYSVINFK